MKHSVIILLVFMAMVGRTLAQCDEFTVFRTKGEVKLVKGGVSSDAEKNVKILPGLQLQVGVGSYAILISGSDKALRVTTPGSLSYVDLQTLCRKNQSSLTKEYLNYVAQSIIEKEEPKTAMVIKGAVYRTLGVYEKTDMILPPDSSVITSYMVKFAWLRHAGNDPLYFFIYENGVNEIFSKKVKDTTVMVPSTLFKPQTIYFWLVSKNEKPTDNEPRFHFVYSDTDWKAEFLDDEATMKGLEDQIRKVNVKIKGTQSPDQNLEDSIR